MAAADKEWTCPKCKTSNSPDFTHCRNCGAHNPQAGESGKQCASCGAKATGEKCCPVCGSEYFLQL